MSETSTETTTGSTATTATVSPWEEAFKGEDPAKVRKALDHAREWEKRAKENADAVKRLADIEEAKKTEEQKASDRLKAIEDRATAAERRAIRSELVAEFKLDKDDAKALEHIESEDGMREIAQRLAAKAEQQRGRGGRVPSEGRTPTAAGEDPMRDFTRNLFGSTD